MIKMLFLAKITKFSKLSNFLTWKFPHEKEFIQRPYCSLYLPKGVINLFQMPEQFNIRYIGNSVGRVIT